MSMAERIFGISSATSALPSRRERFFAALSSFRRASFNRLSISRLQDWDDERLMDIGLTRSDLDTAFRTSTFFEDPSCYLSNAARKRARRLNSLRD
ncbi:DUF1127 domain-containing protein [Rhizobium sp. RAF56]|jgi:uncharacterized protein YjiS (DUF1127 family)|uniref:DUF1127 domain-containing protein n=1 Tax=Rhizobium sp. RAF56 TaxID=3233062 RepID=UPI003F963ACC